MYRQIPFVYASGLPDWTKGEGMYNVDVYSRIRRACHVERMSIREAARQFGLHRGTIKKILWFTIPPGYRRSQPILI